MTPGQNTMERMKAPVRKLQPRQNMLEGQRECHPQSHSSVGEIEMNGLVLHKSEIRSGKVGVSTAPPGESVIWEGNW